MDKRYQVFVSSTYVDLKEERRKVIQTLLEMDCIPTGMELFPAVDEEQFEFIKKVINDCDYYLLIIGGRYGSTTAEGISYTEKEYDYAIECGIKVIAFLHANPGDIPFDKSEIAPELRENLMLFREKVSHSRLVKTWSKAEDLPGLVALSLNNTIKMFPAVGWVRADKASSEDLLQEINDLRKENEKIKREIAETSLETKIEIPDLASLDDSIIVSGTHYSSYHRSNQPFSVSASWREIFAFIAPYLLKYPNSDYVKTVLGESLYDKIKQDGSFIRELNDQDFQTVQVQLIAMKLVVVQYTKTTTGSMGLFWSLTPKGEKMLMELRTVKKKPPGLLNP